MHMYLNGVYDLLESPVEAALSACTSRGRASRTSSPYPPCPRARSSPRSEEPLHGQQRARMMFGPGAGEPHPPGVQAQMTPLPHSHQTPLDGEAPRPSRLFVPLRASCSLCPWFPY